MTVRQVRVLEMYSCGMSFREIGRDLSYGYGTIKDDTLAIRAELGVRTMYGAVAEAFRLGILSPHPLGALA